MKDAKDTLGAIASSIAIDLGEAFRSKTAVLIGVILAIALGATTFIMFIWMAFCSGVQSMKMDKVRSGHENVDFSQAAAENKWRIRFVTFTLLLATSLYLPLTQIALQILMCDGSSFIVNYIFSNIVAGECGDSTLVMLPSYFILTSFSLALPTFLYKEINKHKPQGSPVDPEWTNDVDGLRVKFDDRIYNELVETDTEQLVNPYRSLYRGFSRHKSWWKVAVMIYKLLLIVVVTVLTTQGSNPKIISYASFAFMMIMFLVSTYSEPYVDPLNDIMDESGRFTAIVAAFAGIVAAHSPNGGFTQVMGLLVLITGILNGFIMVCVIFSGIEKVRNFVKNFFGLFTFHDSCKNMGDLTAEYVLTTWQLDREIKHRVWQSFWNGVITKSCADDACKRLVELQRDAIDYGIDYIRDHWLVLKDPKIAENRRYVQHELEGVDLYFDDLEATRDGYLDSVTFFGKMYVKPYPFHIVMVYDDADDESFIQGPENMAKFIALQNREDIKAKVQRRKTLRGLADNADAGPGITWPFSQWEKRTVSDGTETTTDSDGHTHTKTVYSTIDIEIFYTLGRVHVLANSQLSHAPGFNATINYGDGYGQARKPRTGEMYHEKDAHTSQPITRMGFTDLTQFEVNEQYHAFISKAKEVINVDDKVAEILRLDTEYRESLMKKADDADHILANAFWYFVYNDHHIDRASLEKYFQEQETNINLKELFAAGKNEGLDYLYKRMEVVTKDEKSRLWYVFWDDFYTQNKGMSVLKEHLHLFDPTKGTAMCYKPVPTRNDLEKFLSDLKLTSGCLKKYFDSRTIDLLYYRLDYPQYYPQTYTKRSWTETITCTKQEPKQRVVPV
eukprot:GSChrysophyteH1.ASY1.ANO1.3285.1 assembled CDS